MKLNIHPVHFEITDEIRDYAAEKIGRLDKYYKNIIMADVKLVENNGVRADADRFECSVRLSIPGKDVFSTEKGADMMAAIDMVEKELQYQLKKVKETKEPRRIARAKEAIQRFFGKDS